MPISYTRLMQNGKKYAVAPNQSQIHDIKIDTIDTSFA